MTPEDLDKAFATLKARIACLVCEINTLKSTLYGYTTTSTTTTTTTP